MEEDEVYILVYEDDDYWEDPNEIEEDLTPNPDEGC